jgi:hypothetical protein
MQDLRSQFNKEFLKMIKRGISNGNFTFCDSRLKNRLYLIKKGIENPYNFVRQTILELKEDDYYSGPEPSNTGKKDDIYVFRKNIDDDEVYIKVAYKIEGNNIYVTCISFHEWRLI